MNLGEERQAFQAWFLTTNLGKRLTEDVVSVFECTSDCKYIHYSVEVAFDAWLARAKVSPWMSVNDSLPKGEDAWAQWSETVLAGTKKGSIVMAQRSLRDGNSPDWEIIWADTEDGDPFTHWMPLPEPPK